MSRRRLLSPDQLVAARWEFENTAISERGLSARWGWSKSAIHGTIVKYKWEKAEELRTYEGEEGRKQFERDVAAAVKAARDRKIIEGLEKTIPTAPKPNATKPTTGAENGDFPPENQGSAGEDQPDSLKKSATFQTASEAAATLMGLRNRRPGAGEVIPFPGVSLPSRPEKTGIPTSLPARSRTEAAARRIHLANLRGELALAQILALDEHEQLLGDYHHLIAVLLNPRRFVDVEGLDEADAAIKLDNVSRAAARLILPTERDTLSGAILTLNKALLASFAAKRAAAGVTPNRIQRAGPLRVGDEDGDDVPRDLGQLQTDDLRKVKHAMQLLNAEQQRANEPPKPPPPDGLEDLLRAKS